MAIMSDGAIESFGESYKVNSAIFELQVTLNGTIEICRTQWLSFLYSTDLRNIKKKLYFLHSFASHIKSKIFDGPERKDTSLKFCPQE